MQQGITNPIRFQGQYHDPETGLHYNRYRYYDPAVGRFISQDPIGYAGGLNLYAYAPNTVEWIDPLGLSKKCPWPMHPMGQDAYAIHAELLPDTRAYNSRTTATAILVDENGSTERVAASSAGRLSPKQRVTATTLGYTPIGGPKIKGPAGHAERMIIEQYAEKKGMRVTEVAASRGICCDCATVIDKHGASSVTPRRRK